MIKSKNIFSEKTLPCVNQRIKMLIEHYAGGSVKLFSEQIKLSSSQKLNRIFNVDQRNGEYPVASSDILIAIANMFSDVDMNWLFTGKDEMFRSVLKDIRNPSEASVYMIDKIEKQSKEIGRLEKEVEILQDIIEKQKLEVNKSREEDAPDVGNAIAI